MRGFYATVDYGLYLYNNILRLDKLDKTAHAPKFVSNELSATVKVTYIKAHLLINVLKLK